MIYNFMRISKDAIALSLTCKRLLFVSLKQIHLLLHDAASPWAGHRLMCIGDYAEDKDLTQGLLSSENAEYLKRKETNFTTHVSNYCARVNQHRPLHMPDYLYRQERSLQTQVETRQFIKLLNTTKRYYPQFDTAQTWVLCNLTKREYVRDETVKAHGKAGFGAFLLSRICWSSSVDTSMSYEGNICRGVWATDRFEITTIDRPRDGAEGWKDVGDEMGEEMAAIWRSEYGED